ncbi:MerR family transcriptional regulator [Aeromicrobium sp. CF4.19]|uniref:MerR family transcriptional regulator n=1 Tax=Aeromicrobium sp. CF4.19 TaxID=3373082 RepID=UPI003EE669FD
MRSQDVAELAGVTVRTLRHYHQIGILPEPVRRANGYRAYDLATIARLLRIRRLTDLGIPLHQVEEMLETTPDHDVLDEIDRQLLAAIERLQEQRRQIARLRRTGERADIPEGLAELVSLGPSDRSAGVLGEMDQDALLLIARVVGAENLNRQALSDLADALRPLMGDAELIAASEHFDRLPADAPSSEIQQVATRMAVVLEPMASRLERTPTGRALARADDRWPDLSQDSRLNPAQAQAMDHLVRLLTPDEAG